MPRLLEIMRRLRDPVSGCPWDIEQTFATIAPYTLEEAHEVADVIERQAWDELPGELGDLLFQVVLDGVALGLPALVRAVKLQKRAARVGFDWPSTDEVLAKMREEMAELVEARDSLGPDEVVEEFGDLMFVMANLARHMQVDPEAALRAANTKFTRRFEKIEAWLAEAGKTPAMSDLAEMDALWNRAKAEDKAKAGSKTPTGTPG